MAGVHRLFAETPLIAAAFLLTFAAVRTVSSNAWLRTLLPAAAGVAVLWALNARGVSRPAPYLLTGIFIWVCVLKSGVHATLAGVIVALAIPLHSEVPEQPSLLEQLEDADDAEFRLRLRIGAGHRGLRARMRENSVRTEAAIAAALTEGGVPTFEAVVAAAAVIGALTAALLEWANDPDAGPMGDAVTAALALLEVRPPR